MRWEGSGGCSTSGVPVAVCTVLTAGVSMGASLFWLGALSTFFRKNVSSSSAFALGRLGNGAKHLAQGRRRCFVLHETKAIDENGNTAICSKGFIICWMPLKLLYRPTYG